MPADTLVYETTDTAHLLFAPLLVTSVVHDLARRLIVRESHVFLPGEETHRHEIVFLPAQDAPPFQDVDAEAIRRTREMLAPRGGTFCRGARWTSTAFSSPFPVRSLAEHPFHEYWLAGKFRDKLWEIQDWTTSPALRAELARITSCHRCAVEAELLARLFNRPADFALPWG